jgi:hypothetical protein
MMLSDAIRSVIVLLLGGTGALALFFTAYQSATRRRAHMLEVFRQVFNMMDASDVADIRDARRFVYQVHRTAYQAEHWLELDNYKNDHNYHTWKINYARAERVARSFDQLGLLIREGLLPINILARFYASPAVRCWYQLSPYVNALRAPGARNQPGHMWEWENLVCNIIIPRFRNDRGSWRGVSRHDMLEDYAAKILHEREQMIRDKDYSPPQRIWEVGRWFEFWKW